jgi:acyl carrier protein
MMANETDDTYSMLLELIENITEQPADSLDRETRFDSLGNWSSTAAIRLLTKVEDTLGVDLELPKYLSVKTVGELNESLREAQR